MNQDRRQTLIKTVQAEIQKAKKTAESSRATAKEFRRASRSQQGDRKLYEAAADLAESKYEELVSFEKELSTVSEKKCEKVIPFSWVEIEYKSGQLARLYFLPRSIPLKDCLAITPDSPLGQAIQGKKTGEDFSFEIKRDGKNTLASGRIIKIE